MKKYPLNRLFCIFSPKVCSLLLLWMIALLVLGMRPLSGKTSPLLYILTAIVSITLLFLWLATEFPTELTLSDGEVSYCCRVYKRPNGIMSGRYMKRGWCRVSVSRVEDIKFSQNLLERLFNIGKMTLRGKVTLHTELEGVKAPELIRIYGIRNFKSASKELSEKLDPPS